MSREASRWLAGIGRVGPRWMSHPSSSADPSDVMGCRPSAEACRSVAEVSGLGAPVEVLVASNQECDCRSIFRCIDPGVPAAGADAEAGQDETDVRSVSDSRNPSPAPVCTVRGTQAVGPSSSASVGRGGVREGGRGLGRGGDVSRHVRVSASAALPQPGPRRGTTPPVRAHRCAPGCDESEARGNSSPTAQGMQRVRYVAIWPGFLAVAGGCLASDIATALLRPRCECL
jgi:hypothetical protein